MQFPAVLSHVVIGFVVVALAVPLLWALFRRESEGPVGFRSIFSAPREIVAWVKGGRAESPVEGGALFLSLLVALFLIGSAANALSYAIDAWGVTGVAGLLNLAGWEDVRDPFRLPAYLRLLAKGTGEQIFEAQVFRFLYHVSRVIMVWGFLLGLTALAVPLFPRLRRASKLILGIAACYALCFLIGLIATRVARALYDATLAYSLYAAGETSDAASMFAAFGKLPPSQ